MTPDEMHEDLKDFAYFAIILILIISPLLWVLDHNQNINNTKSKIENGRK